MTRLAALIALGTLALACSHPAAPPPPTHVEEAHDPTPTGAPPAPPPAKAPPERWAATVVIGANLIDFVVVFTDPTGVVEVGGKQLAISEITHTADQLAFTVEKPKLPKDQWERYTLARTGATATGTSAIGALTASVKMVELGPDEPAHSAYARPQEPKPPYPYEQRDLVIDAPDGGKLAGTLTMPPATGPGKAPFPAVILLSGSGQQDRDETIFGHKPYLIVADALTRAGFATYRFDDRGTGKTVGAPLSLDTEIADAGAIIDALKKDASIDPKRIGLVGHSAGGMVAPMAALKHPVAFIGLLAGATQSGIAYSAYQTERAARRAGATDAQIKEQQAMQLKISTAAAKGPDEAKKVLEEVVGQALERALGHKPTPEAIAQAIAKPLAETTNPWTMSYFRIDPRDAWKKLAIPALLLVGDKDTQVPADMTIKALEDATKHRKTVTAKKLPGLNHLFQHANTGELEEYLQIDETMDPAALQMLVDWFVAQARQKK